MKDFDENRFAVEVREHSVLDILFGWLARRAARDGGHADHHRKA